MSTDSVLRHHWFDRFLHWAFAGIILVLLFTGLLPPFGVQFDWVPVHWMGGALLTGLTLIHIVRSLFFKSPGSMLPDRQDLHGKPGKYSLSQKAIHHVIALVTLTALVTGGLMTVRVDTPFWERDPYWLNAASWGNIYVLHGLMALGFVSLIMLHVYFALRPEKRMYLRAMFKGRISRAEYEREHDPARWPDHH